MEREETCLLEMKGITKRFPGIVANDEISFYLKAGRSMRCWERMVQGRAL